MAPLRKVHYRPLEAAIRWSGLTRYEAEILEALGHEAPNSSEFERWPSVSFNVARIYDGILNHELPYAIDGITAHEGPRLDDPRLTVRHVDLKQWMNRFYPEQRPAFLFSHIERETHATITREGVQTLLTQQQLLKLQLRERRREIHELRQSITQARATTLDATGVGSTDLSLRAETTYLHLIGAMLHLLLAESPAGQPYSVFRSQEAIITALVAHHSDRLGVSERTLQSKFAAARRALSK